MVERKSSSTTLWIMWVSYVVSERGIAMYVWVLASKNLLKTLSAIYFCFPHYKISSPFQMGNEGLPRTAITMKMMREVAVMKMGIRMSLSLSSISSWHCIWYHIQKKLLVIMAFPQNIIISFAIRIVLRVSKILPSLNLHWVTCIPPFPEFIFVHSRGWLETQALGLPRSCNLIGGRTV